ncbi:MAG TPA: glycosyltransferase [Steroidobacteraceae bacterium]|nr:glycosyltransferase [Steroidobacteraceae bacterium]
MSSDTYPPTRVDITELFGEQLAARGHRIDLLLQSEAACPRSFETNWPGGKVWVSATDLKPTLLHRIRKHLLALRGDYRLFSLLRRGIYDFVIVKDKFLAGVLALAAAKLFRRRFSFWLSYPFPESYLQRARDGTARYPMLYWIRGSVFALLLYRLLLPRACHVFVQSEQMRRDIAARGLSPDSMTAVPMGISVGLQSDIDARHMPADGPDLSSTIVYLGTLARVRRLDFLLHVLQRVRRIVPTATLVFVGSGDDRSEEAFLLVEARRLELDRAVTITGQLPRSRALDYVARAGVCVAPLPPNPVLNSCSPTKLVEYMAMGKAVVATDHPEQKMLIDESGAGYCVAYDAQAFANAVVSLLQDPARAEQMGRLGPAYVLKHRSYEALASIVERKLLQLAAA